MKIRVAVVALLLIVIAGAAGHAQNILIVASGADPVSFQAAQNVRTALLDLGMTATIAYNVTPPTILDYDCAYDLRLSGVLDIPTERAAMQALLANGGGVCFAGENGFFDERNFSIAGFIEALGGGVVNISPADPPYGSERNIPQPVNQSLAIAHVPNDVSLLVLDGVDAGRFLSRGEGEWLTGGDVGGSSAVWDEGMMSMVPGGRTAVVLDINWLTNTFIQDLHGNPTENREFLENLNRFICSGSDEDEDGDEDEDNDYPSKMRRSRELPSPIFQLDPGGSGPKT